MSGRKAGTEWVELRGFEPLTPRLPVKIRGFALPGETAGFTVVARVVVCRCFSSFVPVLRHRAEHMRNKNDSQNGNGGTRSIWPGFSLHGGVTIPWRSGFR